jgi:uncharacterized surface protein with fasciclin (FAS1) repeats
VAIATADVTTPLPVTPVSTATATPNATTPVPMAITSVATTGATQTANITSPTPTATAVATVEATTATVPAVPAPAVPTVATATTPETTPVATATTAPVSIAPSPLIEESKEIAATTPAATETETAAPTITATPSATVTTTATATAVASATPVATPTDEEVPEEMLMQLAETDRNLSTFVNAVQKAGLTDTLNGVGPYTAFAPTNDAFEALPPGTLDALLSDPTRLASVLGHHVAEGRFMAADMAGMPTIGMLEGEPATVTVQADGGLEIDGATVNLTDVRAGNGVLHVIDALILPPDFDATPTATASPAPTVDDATPTATATTVETTTVAPPAFPVDTTDVGTPDGTPTTT